MLSRRSDIDPDRIFSSFDLTRRPALIAAVSGGSDSLAMMIILKGWLERRAADVRLIAVTVDHRLRPESALEADAVAQLCRERGVEHRTLAWTGDKPATGISAAARLARYGLLSQAALDAGTDVIITGHTADDQAETVAMRRERGDGRGLAGMAPATFFHGQTWIVRPFLETARAQLRDVLRSARVDWIDDPTNVNAAYERARTRRGLQGAAAKRDQVKNLLETAKRAAALRAAHSSRAAALIEAHATHVTEGLVRLEPRFTWAAGEDDALLAFRALLAVLGGTEHLPDAGRAAELLLRCSEGQFRATLSRTVIDARRTGVFLYRERRGLPTGPALPGEIWDGRYKIVADVGAASDARASIAVSPPALDSASRTAARLTRPSDPLAPRGENGSPVGRPCSPAADAHPEASRSSPEMPRSLIKAVRATMPQCDRGNVRAMRVLAPWRLFLPSFDIAIARALARLVGAPNVPDPPFAGHNGEEG